MFNIKAIFFDLDDTLVNSRKAERDASIEFKRTFKELDNISDNYFADLWHKIATEQYEKYARGEKSFERQRIDRIKECFRKFEIEKKDEEASEVFKKYLQLYENNWKVFNDTMEVLENLKQKYKLGLITNGDKNQQSKKIEFTEIKKYFKTINISGEIGVSKPDKKIFELACEKVNEDPRDCIMIGDSFKIDIEGAQNAGLNAIWINRKNEDIKYDNQIKELKELLNKL